MYEFRFTKAAEKYFKKIREKGLKAAYRSALNKISGDPYIGELKTGDLAGVYGYDKLLNYENGILFGTTVFGKTVVASSSLLKEK